MLNCIINYFLTIFTALCTWVKIDVMSTIEKKLEEVGENSLFDPTGPPPEAAPAPRPALSLSVLYSAPVKKKSYCAATPPAPPLPPSLRLPPCLIRPPLPRPAPSVPRRLPTFSSRRQIATAPSPDRKTAGLRARRTNTPAPPHASPRRWLDGAWPRASAPPRDAAIVAPVGP